MKSVVTPFYRGAPHARRVRRLAAVGMGLTVAMQGIFFVTGYERGPLYVTLQVLAMLASVTAAWGILALPARAGAIALAVGLGWNGLSRVLHMLFDLTRLSPALNWALTLGYAMACAGALLWALAPARPARGAPWLRIGTWTLAGAYFLSAGSALSSGRLSVLFALVLGCVGFSLVAPNVAEP